MDQRLLIKGNEALGRGAIKAGSRFYFGNLITPQNDIPEYFSKYLLKVEGCFIQAESEIASMNMLFGAAAAGTIATTTSARPGFPLIREGISYMAGSEVPGVIANMMCSDPCLGNISTSPGGYSQATRRGWPRRLLHYCFSIPFSLRDV